MFCHIEPADIKRVKDSGCELAIHGLKSISLYKQHGVMEFYDRNLSRE